MSACKRPGLNLTNAFLLRNSYVYACAACFSSVPTKNKFQVDTPPGKLSESGSVADARPNGDTNGGARRREDVDVEDAARDVAGSVAGMAKAGVVGAMETGLKMGEMAKKTADGMWDAAKKTAESVRDSAADDSDNRSTDRR